MRNLFLPEAPQPSGPFFHKPNRAQRRAGTPFPYEPAAFPSRHGICKAGCNRRTFLSKAGTCRRCFLAGEGPVDEVIW